MATLVDTTTSQPTDVADADAPAQILAGKMGLEGGKRVELYRPDGVLVTMNTEDAPSAFEDGYTFAPQTEVKAEQIAKDYGPIGAKLLAGAAGAARGATLGLSDRALRNFGVPAQALRDLKEGAPATSTASEIGGAVIPALLSGGSSAAAEAGGATLSSAAASAGAMAGKGAVSALGLEGATSVLGRAGAAALEMGVGGAVEGGLYGAGHAVSEDALGRADLNAESLLANAGLGAAMGGVAGGVLGGAGSLAASGVRKASEAIGRRMAGGGVADALESWGKGRIFKAAVGQNKRAFQTVENKGLMDEAENYLGDMVHRGELKVVGENLESIGEKLAARRDAVGSKLDDIVGRLDSATEGAPLDRLSPFEVAHRVEKEVAEPLAKIAANRAEHAQVLQEVEAIRELGNKGMSFAEAAAQRRAIQGKINYDKINGLTAAAEAKNQIAKIWNEVIDEKAAPLLESMGQAPTAYKDARHEFALVQELVGHSENRAAANAANRWASPSDYGAGAIGMLSGHPLTGLAAAAANNVLRRYGNAAAGALALKVARLGVVKGAANAIAERIGAGVDGFLAKSASSAVHKAAIPTTLRVLMDTQIAPLTTHAPKDRHEAAKQRSRELSKLSSDPAWMADRISMSLHGLNDSAPNISQHAALTTAKAMQFLHSKAPKDPGSANTLQPLIDDWRPSDAEVASFERYVRAAFHPMSVIDDLRHGALTPEGVETLKELYPQLHQMTLQKITERLADRKDKLAYEDRVNLSLLFGVPVDDTMKPDFIARTQAMWAAQPKPSSGGQSTGDVGSLGIGENMRSRAQQLEAKR